MIKFRILAAMALLAGAMGSALGAPYCYWEERFRNESDADLCRPAEIPIDLFGSCADRDAWGGGLGANFFSSRMIGIGVDSQTDRCQSPQHANGSPIVRPPSNTGFAPYRFGGAGCDWDNTQWTAQGRRGLELRFNKVVGLFADRRRVFPEDTPDYRSARAGIRVTF
jgi:hypothetical protein